MTANLHLGDCLDVLPTIASESVDAVITDPPYPHIKRDYGYWTVEEWWELVVEGVIPEVRRILKPTGSAVFILQPSSEKVGQMRGWLWEFMAWVCREWNMVQDVWWWNVTALPTGVCIPPERGLLRPSVKVCVWCGKPSCYRNQENVLWGRGEWHVTRKSTRRALKRINPSGNSTDEKRMFDAHIERGGVVPYNLIPIANNNQAKDDAGAHGHGAGTPLKLADWWTRYICPPGGTVCDPFMGSGTMGVAAVQNGCDFIGIERMPGQGYFATAEQRIEEELNKPQQAELFAESA
jgi:site-specific DNA-methyltransferase (cytosine-N4-specific)